VTIARYKDLNMIWYSAIYQSIFAIY